MSNSTAEVDLVGDEVSVNVARAALFAALVGAFAYVSFPIPVTSIPVTLQVLGVFLAGILLGPVWGGAAMVLYLAAGAAGAPVFSGGSAGLGILLGGEASFGYLWSYPVAAVLIGAITHRGIELRDLDEVPVARLVVGMAAGTVVIYTLGAVGGILIGDIGVATAMAQYVLPFIPGEILKLLAAIAIVRDDAIRAG